MSSHILIIEDEADLVQTLRYRLSKEGFKVSSSLTGKEGLRLAFEDTPDLVLLDLMLPDISGTEICRRLRGHERTRQVPIIMVTARTEEIDRVVGFEVGADDYVAKPFSVRELILRIQAVLRRAERAGELRRDRRYGEIEVDERSHQVRVGGEEVALTVIEYRLLLHFMNNVGAVQSRDTLLAEVWGYREGVASRTVDTHVKRLRFKLGEAGKAIQTLRGVGYRLATLDEPA